MSDLATWVGAAGTGLSIIVGAAMIMWQHRAANRTEIKRKLYEELRASLSTANDALQESGSYVFGLPAHVELARARQRNGQQARPPMQRFSTMLDRQENAVEKTVELMTTLKGHLIVTQHFELFHQALTCALKDSIDAHQSLVPVVANMIPFDSEATDAHSYPTFSDAQVEELSRRAKAYWETTSTLSSYIEDILAEAQNLLLADTFNETVKPRQPADARYWVLRTDDAAYLEKLRRHFFVEHPAAVNHHGHGVAAASDALRDIQKKK